MFLREARLYFICRLHFTMKTFSLDTGRELKWNKTSGARTDLITEFDENSKVETVDEGLPETRDETPEISANVWLNYKHPRYTLTVKEVSLPVIILISTELVKQNDIFIQGGRLGCYQVLSIHGAVSGQMWLHSWWWWRWWGQRSPWLQRECWDQREPRLSVSLQNPACPAQHSDHRSLH